MRSERELREQEQKRKDAAGLEAILKDDGEPELKDAEIGRRAKELGKRLQQTVDAVDRDRHPMTGSDIATLNEVITFLQSLTNGRFRTQESLRDHLDREERVAARRSKKIGEWLRG
jgi:hypothetical protein